MLSLERCGGTGSDSVGWSEHGDTLGRERHACTTWHHPISYITSKNEGADTGDKTGQERIEGKRSNQSAVHELHDARQHDVGEIRIYQLQLSRRPVPVALQELMQHRHDALRAHLFSPHTLLPVSNLFLGPTWPFAQFDHNNGSPLRRHLATEIANIKTTHATQGNFETREIRESGQFIDTVT